VKQKKTKTAFQSNKLKNQKFILASMRILKEDPLDRVWEISEKMKSPKVTYKVKDKDQI
jgi:hypothetical protein